MQKYSDIVILCVGSNKFIGDSVGPIVGQKLTRLLKDKKNTWIYGNTKQNLNLQNIEELLKNLDKIYSKAFIITIDAALGPKEMIESIWIGKGKIKIGEALEHSVEYASNLNVKGIVGEYKKNLQQNYKTLNEVQRSVIYKLANKIAYEICQIVEKIYV